ncbi:MAG: S49 family peptidase [Planctomycetota bacterium]
MPAPPQTNRSLNPAWLLAATLGVVVAVGATGCLGSKPVKVCMQGDITAGGTINTVLATDNNPGRLCPRTLPRQPRCGGKIALVDVDGLLVNRNLSGQGSLGENPVALFREKLEAVEADPQVGAVLLRINSPGGGVTACDMMRRDLQRMRERTGLPVVACLMDLGAGGAYYLASASDVVVAHPTTLTGGLGVIFNRYLIKEAMAAQNVFAEPVRVGEMIDIGSPVREITDAEADVLQGIAEQYHNRLRVAVTQARPSLVTRLPTPLAPPGEEGLAGAGTLGDGDPGDGDPEETNSSGFDPSGTVFDGRILLAADAVELGLVDQIGYLDDALATARGLAGAATCRTVVYRRSNDRALTAYDITPNLPTPAVSVPLSIPGLDRSQLPTFLYLWQPEPLLERTGGL